eukprot:g3546.t1
MCVADIEALYRRNAIAMFTKSGLLKRYFSHKFIATGLTQFLQEFFTEDDGTPARFDTEKLRTLLLIVTRNATTGSPWPLSNNPAAKYNDPASPGNNLQIPLWQLVRASTAAPTFFPPEIMRVPGADGEEFEFAFEDGGITPFNNPSYLLKMMATLPEYNLNWKTGTEDLSLVSIGTGTTKTGREKLIVDILSHAKGIPPAVIGAVQKYQDLLCRAHGECRYGPPIDGEVGEMMRPSANAEYLYARYDKVFTDEDLAEAKQITKRGLTLDNLELMDYLCEKGAEQAKKVDNRAALAIVLREEVNRMRDLIGPRMIAVSSAAAGADLVFLRTCVDLRIPAVVILPFPKERFAEDFEDQAEWEMAEHLMSVALAVYVEPGGAEAPEAYRNVSRHMLDWADAFLFAWNADSTAWFPG